MAKSVMQKQWEHTHNQHNDDDDNKNNLKKKWKTERQNATCGFVWKSCVLNDNMCELNIQTAFFVCIWKRVLNATPIPKNNNKVRERVCAREKPSHRHTRTDRKVARERDHCEWGSERKQERISARLHVYATISYYRNVSALAKSHG